MLQWADLHGFARFRTPRFEVPEPLFRMAKGNQVDRNEFRRSFFVFRAPCRVRVGGGLGAMAGTLCLLEPREGREQCRGGLRRPSAGGSSSGVRRRLIGGRGAGRRGTCGAAIAAGRYPPGRRSASQARRQIGPGGGVVVSGGVEVVAARVADGVGAGEAAGGRVVVPRPSVPWLGGCRWKRPSQAAVDVTGSTHGGQCRGARIASWCGRMSQVARTGVRRGRRAGTAGAGVGCGRARGRHWPSAACDASGAGSASDRRVPGGRGRHLPLEPVMHFRP